MTVKEPTALDPRSAERNARCLNCGYEWTVQDGQDVATIQLACKKCDEMFTFAELNKKWVEHESTEMKKEAEKNETHAEKIWSQIKDFHVFRNDIEEVFIVYKGLPVPIGSSDFNDMIQEIFFSEYGKIPGRESMEQVVGLCRFHARKNVREVGVRIARVNGELFYDPLEEDGTVYKITNKVERVRPELPVTVRWKGMLPAPVEHGEKEDFERLISPWQLDAQNRILILGYLGAAFIPDIARVILEVLGEQGSGKSSLCSVVRRIADPTAVERMRVPKDSSGLEIAAKHQYALSLDNVNQILKPELCDALSRLCTGGGSRTRSLYTNMDEVLLNLRRLIIINAINEPSYAMDLLDRMLVIRLEKITEEIRMGDEEMLEFCNKLVPKVRGFILYTLPEAIKLYGGVKAELKGKLPRMADFAIWGESFCRAAGEPAMLFFDAYKKRIESTVEDTLRDSTLFEALLDLLPEGATEPWTGNMTQLLNTLREIISAKYPDKEISKNLPPTPHHLSRKLGELEPALRQFGIGMEDLERSGHKGGRGKKLFRIETKPDPDALSPPPSNVKSASAASAALEQYINPPNETLADADGKSLASASVSSVSKNNPEASASAAASAVASVPKNVIADAADAKMTPVKGEGGKTQNPATEEHVIKSHAKDTVSEIMRFVMKRVQPSEHSSVRDKNNIVRLINAEFKTGPERAKTLVGMWLASGVLVEDGQDKWLLLPGPNAQEASS